ncbi:cation-translocating P-type ATPase [Mycolicibacterium doricum]|uniref:Haloacid dehalogenase n=1 Tax=Mycolicibacterium doricum TaxID=126673 RepID=A0A1X1SZR5_9MYCO|nr:cation-translocating P-type ATPase [Mycolicibacterium doricum]ORV37377.1 haloacid dehalogenase [Mycolicibacterium doricum]
MSASGGRTSAGGTSTPVGEAADVSVRTGTDVAHELDVDPAVGLSAAEAARRLAVDGPNELRPKPPAPLWRTVLDNFRDPLIYLLLAAVVVSLAAWVAEGARGVPIDAVVIALVVLLNAAIGFIQEHRAERAVAALQSVTAVRATVLRDGELHTVPSGELVRGDILVLSEGEAVGADGRLLEASGLRVTEAELTGESEPVTKDPAALAGTVVIGDRTDMVYRGTAVVQGVGRAVVTSTGMDTEMGAIAQMLEDAEDQPTPLQREIARVGKMLGIAVVGIAVVVMAATALANDVSTFSGMVTVLLLGVSLAVAAVPEGLPAIVTVVLALGVERMAKARAIVKDLHSVETLGTASVIASDKTGTLTRNEMTIRHVRTSSGELELTGTGYRPGGEALTAGRSGPGPALRHEAMLVLGGGALANDAQVHPTDGDWEIHGDPTDAAFLIAIHKLDEIADEVHRYVRRSELPFTSERKMMSVVVERVDDGVGLLVTKGAPDVLLSRCTRRQVDSDAIALTEADRRAATEDVEALSAQALRTLAVAYRRFDGDTAAESDEHDLVYLGVVGMIDPPREEVPAAVAEARTAGMRVVMVTGDHPGTAVRIAEELGIAQPGAKAVTPGELDAVSPERLRGIAATADVYARVTPKDKLQIVEALRDNGEVVAVTGDGVNDAPALKAADIGVAMGTGTQVAKEAAQMILGDDNFATIVVAVRQGRVIFDNIRKFLRYLLSSNIGEVFTVFFGMMFAGFLGITGAEEEIAVPLLATQILWVNLITDSAPALAMGVDGEISDVMARPPRRVSDPILDRGTWLGILFVGAVMAVVTLMTVDILRPGGFFSGAESLDTARTAGFTTLVFAQLFNAFNARSGTASAIRNLFANKWLWAAVAFGSVLQIAVVHTPLLQHAFGTVPLNTTQWVIAIAMASLVLWSEELRKLVARHLSSGCGSAPRGERLAGGHPR